MATQKSPETRPLAIVTGASSGIGRELAALAEQHRKMAQPGSADST
jgi:short-subunit dehydrogenase